MPVFIGAATHRIICISGHQLALCAVPGVCARYCQLVTGRCTVEWFKLSY